MKIVTIGRDSNNTIVVNDNFVGRWHLEITQYDDNNFIMKDLDSKNGTFINGRKISGETSLRKNDIVRIGNTTLPWKSYFEKISDMVDTGNFPSKKKKKERKPINWRNVLGTITAIVSLLLMIFALLRSR